MSNKEGYLKTYQQRGIYADERLLHWDDNDNGHQPKRIRPVQLTESHRTTVAALNLPPCNKQSY
eukprot:5799297-Ditylum_brightwellii.AAC.1